MPIGGAVTSFPAGFASGLSVRGMPLLQMQPGNVFWVNNSGVLNAQARAGSDGNRGTYLAPFATLQYAINSCVAGRGDIIFVGAGHAENVIAAGGITLNKAGVAIVGLGGGNLRPAFTFTTIATASISLAANDVSIQNCRFISAIAACATCFDQANAQVATDFAVDNCAFLDSSTTLNFVAVMKIGTTANISSGFRFTNNKVRGIMAVPTANTTAIILASDAVRWELENNFVSHNVLLAATACLLAAGANNLTNSLIKGNIVCRPNTDASNPLLCTNTGTGWGGTMVMDNYCGQLSGITGLVMNINSKASFVNNYAMITGAADKSASVNPVAV